MTHRVFDAIKAESELTGRFTAISLSHWTTTDLVQIPKKGFHELGTDCPASITEALCSESHCSILHGRKQDAGSCCQHGWLGI